MSLKGFPLGLSLSWINVEPSRELLCAVKMEGMQRNQEAHFSWILDDSLCQLISYGSSNKRDDHK